MKRRLATSISAVPRLVLQLGLMVVVAIFLAGTLGGFDFTDEGNYYLSFVHPENVSDNQTSYYLFGGKIFSLLGHNIVAMRVCTLFATASGTLIFLRGVRRFVRRFAPELLPDRERGQFALCSTLVASFLGYGISPAALSYNFQNAFCLLVATGFLLSACAREPTGKYFDPGTWLALAGFGVFAGLDFFIKFSSSVPLAIVGCLFFLLTNRQGLGQKASFLSALLACLVVTALAYFTVFQNFTQWRAGIAGTFGAIVDGGYAAREIRRYGGEIAEVYAKTLVFFLPVWAVAVPGMAAVAALRRWPRCQQAAAAITGLWSLGVLVWLINVLEYYSAAGPSSASFFLGTLLLFLLLAATSRWSVRGAGATCTPGRWCVLPAAGFLFLLPYIGAFGTNNALHLNTLYQLAPWFVVAAWLLAEIDRVWRTSWPSRLGLLLLAAVAAGQFYQGYWLQPYRMGVSRVDLAVPTPIGFPPSNLRLTPEAHEFVVTSRRILLAHGFRPGDDLLVFFNLPGFVFAMGGASPGHPWYFQGDLRNYELDLMRLRFIEPARLHRAFIVRNSVETDWNTFLPYLRKAGVNFPTDYRLITPPMSSPFTGATFEIWAPVRAAR